MPEKAGKGFAKCEACRPKKPAPVGVTLKGEARASREASSALSGQGVREQFPDAQRP